MVDVFYDPIKKIILHEIIKYNLSEFIQSRHIGPDMQPLRWIDGIVFSFNGMPLTPELINEQVKGTIHWSIIEFAEMQEYQPRLQTNIPTIQIPVVDNSNNTAVADVIRWLKKQSQWASKDNA